MSLLELADAAALSTLSAQVQATCGPHCVCLGAAPTSLLWRATDKTTSVSQHVRYFCWFSWSAVNFLLLFFLYRLLFIAQLSKVSFWPLREAAMDMNRHLGTLLIHVLSVEQKRGTGFAVWF